MVLQKSSNITWTSLTWKSEYVQVGQCCWDLLIHRRNHAIGMRWISAFQEETKALQATVPRTNSRFRRIRWAKVWSYSLDRRTVSQHLQVSDVTICITLNMNFYFKYKFLFLFYFLFLRTYDWKLFLCIFSDFNNCFYRMNFTQIPFIRI